MDIPMINEINENTNAAKKEILEAMPAAGATSAEVEAAKTAIIGAMPSGGGLLIPEKYTFVNAKSDPDGNVVTAVNVSGKGRFLGSLCCTNFGDGYTNATVILDGVTVFDGYDVRCAGAMTSIDAGLIDFVFVKSLVIKIKGAKRNSSSGTKYYTVYCTGRIEHYS